MKSLQTIIWSQLQAKHLVVTQGKKKRNKMVFYDLLQQNVSEELHMIEMLKQFCLELGEAGAANWFDIRNLDVINYAITIT